MEEEDQVNIKNEDLDKEQNNDLIISKIKKDKENLGNRLKNLEANLTEKRSQLEQMIQINEMAQVKLDSLEADNNSIKKQNKEFQEIYQEMEQRKNNEISALNNRIKDLENKYENLKSKNKTTEETNSKLNIENSKLKSENNSLKFDRDFLTNQIKDKEQKASIEKEEKEKLNELIDNYKRKTKEIELEKIKFDKRVELYEKRIKELSEEYDNLIKEKMNDFEMLERENKNKYEEIIGNKNEEIEKLKEEILKLNLEKDKYKADNATNAQLLEDAENKYNSEKNKYFNDYIKAKEELNLVEKSKTDEINNLIRINKELENENNEIKYEIQILKNDEKYRIKNVSNLQQNLNKLENELNQMRTQKSYYDKENDKIKNDKEQLIAMYEQRIKKMKEDYENKIYYLEDINEKQNKKLNLMENKAFEMVKNQQIITEKYKKELNNAINYYEGFISNLSTGKEGNISNNIFS